MARKTKVFKKLTSYQTLEDVDSDIRRIEEAFDNLSLHSATEVSSASPDKPVQLQISYADGVNWNPGKGEGLYIYVNTYWRKIITE